jgi:two-component system sensor histidine kinase EvgS
VGVRAHADAGHVTLEVHDNGVGIAPEHQANLFDYFEQSGAKNAHEMSGSGVGLALTRALVQRLGGEISVASALGVGSVFMVKLRRAGLTMLPQPRAAS